MNHQILQNLLIFGGILFCIGLVGFLTRRSLILMFLSLETMLAGVSVNLVAFGMHHENYQGQIMAIMVLTVAACEAAIALAMVVSLYRRKPTLDVHRWSELSEVLASETAEAPVTFETTHQEFPSLTPSGLDPLVQPVPATFDPVQGEASPHTEKKVSEVTSHA